MKPHFHPAHLEVAMARKIKSKPKRRKAKSPAPAPKPLLQRFFSHIFQSGKEMLHGR